MAEDPAAVLRGSGWIEGISATEESKPLRSETQTDKPKGLKPEKWWNTAIQVGIPFFIAGVGTIAAGIILGHVEVEISFRRLSMSSYKKLSAMGCFSIYSGTIRSGASTFRLKRKLGHDDGVSTLNASEPRQHVKDE